MSYLVSSVHGIKEFQELEDVISYLAKVTAWWCAEDTYSGPPAKELFQRCIEAKNFGGIAQVYEIDCFMLCLMETRVNHSIKRIM